MVAQILNDEGRAAVSDLSERLGVSQLTVRRDLDYLERLGIIYRRYGEAVLCEAPAPGHRGKTGISQVERAKVAIASYAAGLVENSESIFVNTSSTAQLAIELMQSDDVTIITNSTRVGDLAVPQTVTVLVTGGEIRMPRGVLSGEFALANIRSVSANRCYVGCAGVSATTGVTSTTLQEATVNSLMISRSDYCVLMCDSSKIGVEAGFKYADLSSVDLMVTDMGATVEELEELSAAGIQRFVRVNPNEPAAPVNGSS